MRADCDRCMVLVDGGYVLLVVGADRESHPREFLGLSGADARQLARALEEAAALLSERLVPT